jgi:uncharacterized protein (DUF427 family)
MTAPHPDHPITLSTNPRRVRAKIAGHVIADSVGVLTLAEADYPLVSYFPREDVEMGFLVKTDHVTHCPYKGDASYFTLHIEGRLLENAVWSYEKPLPEMAQLSRRLAFYPDQVEIYEIDP